MNKGFSTLEILIALSLFVLVIGGIAITAFGNQSVGLDTELSTRGLYKAERELETLKTTAAASWNLAASAPATFDNADDTAAGYPPNFFKKQITVTDTSPCAKQATSTVTWNESPVRISTTTLQTTLVNPAEAIALGGDCATEPPTGGWNPPVPYASDNFNPGKPTASDALGKIDYIGGDKKPFLFIADARNAVLGQNGGLFVTFSNSFNSDGKTLDQINDIDVYKDGSTGKVYAFVATASSTAQLAVIDVTDIHNPVLKATRSLNGVGGAQPNGWRLYYYNQRLYILTRYTAGPEFHVFDVSNPASPTELGSGYQLGTTASDLAVRDGIAYLAVGADVVHGELLVLNVSDPTNITEITGASRDFLGNENGSSILLIGSKLYFGRKTNSGPELYILDASAPLSASGGLPILSSQEIGADVLGIRVSGRFGFLAVSSPQHEFQVWPASLVGSAINIYNFGNVISGGIDYDSDWMFVASMANDSLQILYSP